MTVLARHDITVLPSPAAGQPDTADRRLGARHVAAR
jgi:hypothetical protein